MWEFSSDLGYPAADLTYDLSYKAWYQMLIPHNSIKGKRADSPFVHFKLHESRYVTFRCERLQGVYQLDEEWIAKISK